ncbi:MAG: hypothetical protein Q7S58_12735 [Candidatus Binatus sp.]|uniref:hypothetical protein n=1 Tax=Candidatus Binatus sp. TaxID=2811406 RepID=UPI0027250EF7|nr:hypothetical protein [Candidatus Binatus sp.]MDO8433266.1 hypothetical protein [Candidatus Binatus sp.]
MEALAISTDLAERLGSVRSLIETAPIVKDAARRRLMSRIRELDETLIALITKVRDDLYTFLRAPDEAQSPGKIDEAIVVANLIATKLEASAEVLGRSNNFPRWHKVYAQRIAELSDELRDIEETLALGRSAAFQGLLESAKREAAN